MKIDKYRENRNLKNINYIKIINLKYKNIDNINIEKYYKK